MYRTYQVYLHTPYIARSFRPACDSNNKILSMALYVYVCMYTKLRVYVRIHFLDRQFCCIIINIIVEKKDDENEVVLVWRANGCCMQAKIHSSVSNDLGLSQND